MPKPRRTLNIRIPAYAAPRTQWRKKIHAELTARAEERGVAYQPGDELELHMVLHLGPRQISFHDVDNRLRDIMDALQGRAGGPKAKRTLRPIVPNDRQIYKVTIEKKLRGRGLGLGHLTVRKYRA